MPKKRNSVGERRLTFKVEFGTASRDVFTENDFKLLVNEAIRVTLGLAAPSYKLGPFDKNQRKGSVIVQASDVHLIWAALSVYGRHFGRPVALHLNSLTVPRIQ